MSGGKTTNAAIPLTVGLEPGITEPLGRKNLSRQGATVNILKHSGEELGVNDCFRCQQDSVFRVDIFSCLPYCIKGDRERQHGQSSIGTR